MREFKAKVSEDDDFVGYEASVYVDNNWRTFGCPVRGGDVVLFRKAETAKAAAERMADAFKIKLKWEEK